MVFGRRALQMAIGLVAVAIGVGLFAFSDPEGNSIQLWQPGGTEPG
jgi:predicted enzyme related to lactoylglutathione lyase